MTDPRSTMNHASASGRDAVIGAARRAFRAKRANLLPKADGVSFVVDVSAGDLQRQVGEYPVMGHRMLVCCSAMRQAMRSGDQVVAEPASGMGTSLTIRYCLPRNGIG